MKRERRAVGRALKDGRLKAGLTQWDLAHALGYSTAQFISNWERGVSLPPKEAYPVLQTICRLDARHLAHLVFDFRVALAREEEKDTVRSVRDSLRSRRGGESLL